MNSIPFMHQTFTVGRYHLRLPTLQDVTELNRAVLNNRTDLKRFMPWALVEPDKSDTEQYLKSLVKRMEKKEEVSFLIMSDKGRVVGGIGFHHIDWDIPKTEIGYWLDTDHRGQGLMTAAVCSIRDLAISTWSMSRFEIQTAGSNRSSQRVAERCGFTRKAVLKRHRRLPGGAIDDTHIYAWLTPSGDAADG